jgi:hypothetical protein
MPPSGHPGVVTGAGCPLCDGNCQHPWQLPSIPSDYPFLPKEMVQAMQPTQDTTPTPAPDATTARGRRRGENRARHLDEDTAHHGGEDR